MRIYVDLSCTRCSTDITVDVHRTAVRAGDSPEMLFRCTECGAADTRRLPASVCPLLRRAGVEPLCLDEDLTRRPARRVLSWTDLFRWQEILSRSDYLADPPPRRVGYDPGA